jgi:hypothetical protein
MSDELLAIVVLSFPQLPSFCAGSDGRTAQHSKEGVPDKAGWCCTAVVGSV